MVGSRGAVPRKENRYLGEMMVVVKQLMSKYFSENVKIHEENRLEGHANGR